MPTCKTKALEVWALEKCSFVNYFFFSQTVRIFFSFLHENIMLWYSLEVPRQGTSNEYPQHMFSWRIKENIHMIPPPPHSLSSRDVDSILVFFSDKTYVVGFH